MKIKEIRKELKRSQLVFFTFKKLTDSDFHAGLREFKQRDFPKTKGKIKEELSLIRNYWKCDPMDYYRYRLFEKDLSDEELLDYIPKYYFYNYYMPAVYENVDLSIPESKIKMMGFFVGKGIVTPPAIVLIKHGKIFDNDNNNISYEEMIQKMLESEAVKFFVKPDDGQGGNGIIVIKKIENRLYINSELISKNQFLKKVRHNDFILQEGLTQRSDINEINPSSVNTLRVVTQKKENKFRISAVVLRIGRNGSFVDNSCQGGISVKVDIESGILNKYGYTEHTNEKFERHPDTQFLFDGNSIKGWHEIKAHILDFANKSSEFPEVGWDIAILENNISVIEINTYYALELLQCCSGGMRRQLDVYPVNS